MENGKLKYSLAPIMDMGRVRNYEMEVENKKTNNYGNNRKR